MRRIGLTGGIASGKSTVTAILAELGAAIIDADRVAHRTYEPDQPAFAQIVQAFGPEVVGEDGSIDRRILGGKVFGDPAQLRRLTDIVWPATRALADVELRAREQQGVDVAVLEAAVLIEAGWQDLVDEVWVVTVPRAVARTRLMERNGLSPEDADRRIDAQLESAEREAHADVTISTDCPLAEVRGRVEAAWEALRRRVAAAG